MPFGLGWFDYKIPIELEKSIQIGQLVKIPFRRSSLFGIVFEITAETEIKGGAKEIEKIIKKKSKFNNDYSFILLIFQY